MSIETRKKMASDQLRRRILAGALRVFAEQGYDKVSMRKIAALIDYSPTTIYRFFKNKEELLQTIAAGTYEGLAARFSLARAGGGDDSLAVLKALVREYVIYCAEHPDMFRLFTDIASFELEEGVIYERLGEGRHQVFQSWFQLIRRVLADGRCVALDEMRLFRYLWSAADGFIGQRIRHPDIQPKPLAEDVAEYLELLFSGIESRTQR